jgi:hypothetical protein
VGANTAVAEGFLVNILLMVLQAGSSTHTPINAHVVFILLSAKSLFGLKGHRNVGF